MWRRIYILLLAFRLYFALSPSYLHPDENFQGPEVIAGEPAATNSSLRSLTVRTGQVFNYPVHHTWEFTSAHPIRSVFPLWLVYGLPMLILRSLWEGLWKDELPPAVVYWTLRVLMFTLSFVLEDWAIQELINSPRSRRVAVLLVASSYVTWTFQTHTFSNAIETLVVLWSLVLIQRITEDRERTSAFASAVLAFLLVLGGFNRITFPAYLLIPGLRLFPHFVRKPLSLVIILLTGSLVAAFAIILDTGFYRPEVETFRDVFGNPTLTPWNNFLYNASPENLASHGLHPIYQHLVANLPLLLGPAYIILPFFYYRTIRLASAISGILFLSLFPHQEARFLIPAVPLILSSLKIPAKFTKYWMGAWIAFNLFFGMLMGTFHQGGVVPMQIHLAKQTGIKQAFWWKTYSPPIWLLDGKSQKMGTTDLKGGDAEWMIQQVLASLSCKKSYQDVVLVAPASATFLDQFQDDSVKKEIILEERWRYTRHLNLDDIDFANDGIWGSIKRVLGRGGLVLWHVQKRC